MLKEISIEIIRKCPNNCKHCSSMSDRHCTEIVEFGKFREVIDGALTLGVETICFSGGEPFLHPNIVEMIKYVFSKDLKSYIYTSGISFGLFENYISLPDEIISDLSGYVTKLIFNIEAAKEEAYDLIMGTQGCFSLMKASALKAAEISLTDTQTKKLKDSLLHMKKEASVDIRIGMPLSERKDETKCEAANGKLNIKYDGGVFPCEVFKNNSIQFQPGIKIPNIFNEDIVSIYNKSKYLVAVRNYIKCFSCNANCENCVGQYLIDTQEEVGETNG